MRVHYYYLLHGKEKPEYAVFPEPYQAKDRFYFQEFEPLLKEELTYITALLASFEFLKSEADKISDLNRRELYLY